MSLSWKTSSSPSAGDTFVSVSLGNSNGIDHFVLFEDGIDWDVLFEESKTIVNFLFNGSSVDLNGNQNDLEIDFVCKKILLCGYLLGFP